MRWFFVSVAVLIVLAAAILVVVFIAGGPHLFVTLIGPVVSVTLTFVLFVGLLHTLVRVLRFAWARIPATVWSLDATQLDKALAVLFSLGIFPGIAIYAWRTAQSIFRLFPELIQLLAGFQTSDNCSSFSESDTLRRCVSGLATELVRIAQLFASKIIEALNLDDFPVRNFIWFLACTLLFAQVIAIIRQRVALGDVITWVSSRIAWSSSRIAAIPTVTWQRMVFTALVVLSFYLGLTALLAIPLLDDKSRSQHTADSMGKALEAYLIRPEVFDTSFPPKLSEVVAPLSTPPPGPESGPPKRNAEFAKRIIDEEVEDLNRLRGQLQEPWSALRTGAQHAQGVKVQTAKDLFAGTVDVNLGKRQTDRYYYALLKWFGDTVSGIRFTLSRCHSAANILIGEFSDSAAKFRSAMEQTENLSPVFREYYRSKANFYSQLTQVLAVCGSSELPPSPDPPTIASGLGEVGTWTKWLINTERMPVVIIVGLVGFSLLGATVSRAVRAQTDERPRAAFTLDDLLTVIAGGTTAAVVVFLAAYGGLAVLGNSTGDPNPYIVFATCLIAAVYSEDVWTWARRRLLAAELGGRNNRKRRAASRKARGEERAGPVTKNSADRRPPRA